MTDTHTSDWGFVISKVLQFLTEYPEMRQAEQRLWEHVLESLHPLTGNHGKTCRGSIGTCLVDFHAQYAPTLKLINQQHEATNKQLPCALTEISEQLESVKDTRKLIDQAKVEPELPLTFDGKPTPDINLEKAVTTEPPTHLPTSFTPDTNKGKHRQGKR